MNYEGNIFRPPSEANSLLIQVTIGCSHNKCIFCSMYKDKQFRIKDLEDIKQEILDYKNKDYIKRIFLCDGDALVLSTNHLLEILKLINSNFKNIERITSYATFRDILNKSVDELVKLREAGLTMVYLGMESGSDDVLQLINKNITAQEMIEASKKLKQAKIKQSVIAISGLGGRKYFSKHALETAKVISEIDPEYFGLLSLMVMPNTKLFDMINNNEFELILPYDCVQELALMLENINVSKTHFSSNHISNYVYINGILPDDKKEMLASIKEALDDPSILDVHRRGL